MPRNSIPGCGRPRFHDRERYSAIANVVDTNYSAFTKIDKLLRSRLCDPREDMLRHGRVMVDVESGR